MTARVKRMLFVQNILYIFFLWTVYTLELGSIGYIFIFFMSMPIVMLANTLLIPWENAMKKYYYTDAKKRLREHPNLKIIGITGSYGKTSTKFILEKILSKEYNTLITPHSYNTTLGVILTIRNMLRRSHEVFVVEMGAKQKEILKKSVN